METYTVSDNHQNIIGRARRTNHNARIRPNAAGRHDPVESDDTRISEDHFISDTKLEWTSLNYRKEKAARIHPSRRRMVLMMY